MGNYNYKDLMDEIMNEEYRFTEFDDIPNKPVDIFTDTIYLGTIQITSDNSGYEVKLLSHPNTGKNIIIKPNNTGNKFKTKLEAAKQLHSIWKLLKAKS